MSKHKDELKYNGEGYYDPTAYEALSKIEVERIRKEKERFERVLGCIYRICELTGYRIENRIVLKDLKSGRTFRSKN